MMRNYVLGKNGGVPPSDDAAHLLLKARVEQEIADPDDQLMAWLAACVYYQAQAQGASELEALATVYHAGHTHMLEAQKMVQEPVGKEGG